MKSAFDLKHVRSVIAAVLVYEGRMAGRVVVNCSDNPAGSVHTATVVIYEGPLALPGDNISATDKAGGYGYCKTSSAVYGALLKLGLKDKLIELSPGNGQHWREFEHHGYTVMVAC